MNGIKESANKLTFDIDFDFIKRMAGRMQRNKDKYPMGKEMTNFIHSGATGDLIFSLPTIRAMGGGNLFITNFDKQRSESIKKLIELQPYIHNVVVTDHPPEGIDLNLFRQHAGHHSNLVEAHFKGQGIPIDETWRDGWLTLPEPNFQLFPGHPHR